MNPPLKSCGDGPCNMMAPDGPQCACGRPSRHQSGWCMTTWQLRSGFRDGDKHATITEVHTGTVACGESWCNGYGYCGLPALVVTDPDTGDEYRVFGSMVALGLILQPFRVPWTGAKVEADVHYQEAQALCWI